MEFIQSRYTQVSDVTAYFPDKFEELIHIQHGGA